MQKNILEYLEATAARYPDKLAFSTGEQGMTFSCVLREARGIGSFLAARGYSGRAIAVIMEKHPKTVTAFFGIIYAADFYVCIDERMPQARMKAIIDTVDPAAIICDEKNRATACALGVGQVFLYDEICTTPEHTPSLARIRRRQIDTDAIYIVFTSGSTGVPKGVVAAHRSVIDYTESLCTALGFSCDTVFANQTPLYFDAPLKEIMPTIKLGATTYFVPRVCFSFPVRMIEYLNRHKINTICWVTSALVQISSLGALDVARPEHLHTVAFGSEVFPRKQYDIWRAALPTADFYNLYGPTEATGMSCYWHADRTLAPDEPIPIGAPFDNTALLLLDEQNADADTGEICIRGTCLTMGYYGDKEKTDGVFVQNPLNTAYPELIYRTGDLGRLNERGELVFLGRKDSQIKHQGHRIELGEIESAALSPDGVRMACCVYDGEQKRIALYYTGEIGEDALTSHLRSVLPRYMLPAILTRLGAMPLTVNGKMDRKGLRQRAAQEK